MVQCRTSQPFQVILEIQDQTIMLSTALEFKHHRGTTVNLCYITLQTLEEGLQGAEEILILEGIGNGILDLQLEILNLDYRELLMKLNIVERWREIMR